MSETRARLESALVDAAERVNAIRELHHKAVDEHGGSDGCAECGLGWPCPTVHFAAGYGGMYECWDAGWCSHFGEKVDPAESGLR